MHVHDELLEQERRFWGAAGDGDFYRRHFADDGVCVLPVGVLDKDATIHGVEQAQPWTDVDFDDVRVISFGSDAAAIVYTARGRRTAGGAYRAGVTSVYRRVEGHWLLTVHQQTPLAT